MHQLFQPKLVVGPAGDSYEQEADRVAEQVMNAPSADARKSVQRQEDEEEIQTSLLPGAVVLRQEEEEEVQTSRIPFGIQAEPDVQRQEDEEEVQTKPLSAAQGGFQVDAAFEDQLKASRGHGDPLPDNLREEMEPRLGTDLQGVRIHHGSNDAELNRSISAQAFTMDQDIYMGAGKYDPQSPTGKRLLAHELAHTIQQSGGKAKRMTTRPTLIQAKMQGTYSVLAGVSTFGRGWNNILKRLQNYEKLESTHLTKVSSFKRIKLQADTLGKGLRGPTTGLDTYKAQYKTVTTQLTKDKTELNRQKDRLVKELHALNELIEAWLGRKKHERTGEEQKASPGDVTVQRRQALEMLLPAWQPRFMPLI